MSPSAAGWRGCHGVQLTESPFDFCENHGDALAHARLTLGDVPASQGPRLWTQEGGGVTRWLSREGSCSFLLDGTSGPRVAVDVAAGVVTATTDEPFLTRQLVAAFALGLIAYENEALLVHGAACARDGVAIVLVGPSGAGKSSALVALTNDGWRPISEDVCSIDLRSGVPRVWPGPPWVRVLRGDPGPDGASVASEGREKTAWEIEGRQPAEALPLGRLFVLSAGAAVGAEAIDAAGVLQALAPHTVWLTEPDRRVATLFPRVASVARAVPATSVLLRRHAGWRDDLLALVRV